jgi:hypothetical protein
MTDEKKPQFDLAIGNKNGSLGGRATITVLDADGAVIDTDKGDMFSVPCREKVSGRLAARLKVDPEEFRELLEAKWLEFLSNHRRDQEPASDQAGNPVKSEANGCHKPGAPTDAGSQNTDESDAMPPDDDDGRPVVLIGVDEARVNRQATAAVAMHPDLYQRANMLVHVLRDQVRCRSIIRPPGSPRIAPLPNAKLREMMAETASWWIRRKRGEKVSVEPAHPPEWSVNAMVAQGNWPEEVRYLEAVVEAPTLRPNGTILATPGWDPETGLLYEPRLEFPAVPDRPSKDVARAAADRLLALVINFPFKGDEHKAAWLSGLLTLFARFAYHGPTPLFLYNANSPGTGKTLLPALSSEIYDGRDMARTPYVARDEEMRKTITAVALAGDKTMLFDNIDQGTALGCASLDAALTTTSWKDRILGTSQMTADLPLFTIWFASGNNVSLRGDIHRRVVPCRLETEDEHPEERTGFAIPDLIGHVRHHRAKLVADVLTVLRGYFVAGQPDQRLTPMGSYEGWCRVVRGAVYWATGLDPLATREGIVNADEALVVHAALLEGWSQLPGGKGTGVTVAQALRYLRGDQANQFETLRDALMPLSKTDKLPTEKLVGYRLRALRGRVVNGRSIQGEPNRDGVVPWRVMTH